MKKLLTSLLIKSYSEQRAASKDAVDCDKDIVTECDLAIGNMIKAEIAQCKFPVKLVTEEYSNAITNSENPEYTIYVDELDGTDNAFRNINMLPSVTLIQIANTGSEDVKFGDFVMVGAVEHSSGKIYIAERGCGIEKYEIIMNNFGITLTPCAIEPRHPKQSVVITDVYSMMKETEVLFEIASRYQTKDFGASAATYLWVAEGLFEAYASSHKKGHELPLLYLLCKEAGVKMTDFAGKEYDEVGYDFNSTRYQVVAGIDSVHADLVNALMKFAKEM